MADVDNMSPEEIAAMQKEQCIFCKIIHGEIPSKQIYDDDLAFVILDINPANEGHLIILPKEHYQIMPQLPEETLNHLTSLSKKLSKTLLQSLQTGGTSIFIANGAAAGQRAPHFMIHVIPRKKDDELFKLPKKEIQQSRLVEIQKVIINNLSKMLKRPAIMIEEEVKPETPIQKEELTQEEEKSDDTTTPQQTEDTNTDKPDNQKSDLDDISKLFL